MGRLVIGSMKSPQYPHNKNYREKTVMPSTNQWLDLISATTPLLPVEGIVKIPHFEEANSIWKSSAKKSI